LNKKLELPRSQGYIIVFSEEVTDAEYSWLVNTLRYDSNGQQIKALVEFAISGKIERVEVCK
jgi:hypothetical protein